MKPVQKVILLLSVLVYIGLIYIASFNGYQTDDYIFSYGTHRLGITGNIRDFYMNWGGRYFGYTINMFNPVASDPENIVPVVYPIILMSAFIAVTALNFRKFFSYTITESITKSFTFFFFYTVMLVSLPEHYYWFTGANIYFLPFILSGILLFSYGRYLRTHEKGWLFLSIILVAFLMGANEVIALLLTGSLILVCFQNPSRENKILLAVGVAGMLISFLAPGNFKRMGDSADVFYMKWIKRAAFFSFNTAYIFIKTVLILPLFMSVFYKELRFIQEKISFKKSLVVCGISFLPLLLLGYIINIIGRQFENVIIFFLVTLSVVAMFRYEQIRKYWWISMMIVFLPETDIFPKNYINYNMDYNLNNGLQEIFITDLEAYKQEIESRINILDTSAKDSLVLRRIRNVPKILYFDELSTEKEEKKYVNDQLEKYFHKKHIVVE